MARNPCNHEKDILWSKTHFLSFLSQLKTVWLLSEHVRAVRMKNRAIYLK